MEGLENVKRELESKRKDMAQELSEAKEKVTSIEGDLKRLDDALGALKGKKTKAKSRPKKVPPTPQELRDIVAAVREEHPFAAGDELEEAVRGRVKKSGASLTGFRELYQEALSGAGGAFISDRLPHDRFRRSG